MSFQRLLFQCRSFPTLNPSLTIIHKYEPLLFHHYIYTIDHIDHEKRPLWIYHWPVWFNRNLENWSPTIHPPFTHHSPTIHQPPSASIRRARRRYTPLDRVHRVRDLAMCRASVEPLGCAEQQQLRWLVVWNMLESPCEYMVHIWLIYGNYMVDT